MGLFGERLAPHDLGQQGPDVTMQFVGAGHLMQLDNVAAQIVSTLAPLQRDAFVSYDGKRTVDEAIKFLDREMKALQGR